MTVLTYDNFIEFLEVASEKDSVQRYSRLAIWDKITNSSPGRTYHMKLREHQAELFDDRINFLGLSEPKKINYLNMEESFQTYPSSFAKNNDTSVIITLGGQKVIEKRKVYDTFVMLGDVGGLMDFLMISLSSFVQIFSSHFLKANLMSLLFRKPIQEDSRKTTQR